MKKRYVNKPRPESSSWGYVTGQKVYLTPKERQQKRASVMQMLKETYQKNMTTLTNEPEKNPPRVIQHPTYLSMEEQAVTKAEQIKWLRARAAELAETMDESHPMRSSVQSLSQTKFHQGAPSEKDVFNLGLRLSQYLHVLEEEQRKRQEQLVK